MLRPCPDLLCLAVCCLLCCCCEVWPVSAWKRDVSSTKDGDKQTPSPVISPETWVPLFCNQACRLQEFRISFYWFCKGSHFIWTVKGSASVRTSLNLMACLLPDIGNRVALRRIEMESSSEEPRCCIRHSRCTCQRPFVQLSLHSGADATHTRVSSAARFTCGLPMLKSNIQQLQPQIDLWLFHLKVCLGELLMTFFDEFCG